MNCNLCGSKLLFGRCYRCFPEPMDAATGVWCDLSKTKGGVFKLEPERPEGAPENGSGPAPGGGS